MALRKATRLQTKLRMSISGISGSGKTYSSLQLAKGLVGSWDKIAIINTEKGRADVYADIGSFNVLELDPPFSPEKFIAAIHEVEQDPTIECIIIDSGSSEWQDAGGCLEINENLANTKYRGNSWAAWNEVTPRHQKFIEAIKSSHCHVIITLMAKESTAQIEGKVKKLGDKEIQREGFRRDMIIGFGIDHETHHCMTLKDNTFLFDKVDPFIISEETGKIIRSWTQGGEPVKHTTPVQEDIRPDEYSNVKIADVKDIPPTEITKESLQAQVKKVQEAAKTNPNAQVPEDKPCPLHNKQDGTPMMMKYRPSRQVYSHAKQANGSWVYCDGVHGFPGEHAQPVNEDINPDSIPF